MIKRLSNIFTNRFKKNKRKSFVDVNSHKHLRSNVPKKKKTLQIIKPTKKLKPIFYIVILTIILLGGIIYYIFFTNNFIVKQVSIHHLSQEDPLEVPEIKNYFLNKNIISLNVSEAENSIKEYVPFVTNIFVRKVFPEKIEVFVGTYSPEISSCSFNACGYYSSEIDKIDFELLAEPFVLSELEQRILDKKINLKDTAVDDFILKSIDETEVESFSWDDVSDETRINAIASMERELEIKINDFKQKNIIESNENTPFVFFMIENDNLDLFKEEIIFSNKIYQKLTHHKFEIDEITWKNDRYLEVRLKDNKIMIFTKSRNFNAQLEAIDYFINNNGFSMGNTVDFRTDIISVR